MTTNNSELTRTPYFPLVLILLPKYISHFFTISDIIGKVAFCGFIEGEIMSEEKKRELEKYIESIAALPGVLQIYLFGSHAYGEPDNDSDIDLMIVVEDSLDPFKTAYKIRRSFVDSDLVLDIIVNKKKAFEKASTEQSFQKIIKDNGVLLYAQ